MLQDDLGLLVRVMPFVRCLNSFVLDVNGWLPRDTLVYRASRMSKRQAAVIDVGTKYRIGMYVATSTQRDVIKQGGKLLEWQQRETGDEHKFSWAFSIPAGCRQAALISEVSAHAGEHEVLLVPYTAVLVTKKEFDVASGAIVISANVLEDSMVEEKDLPTIVA